MVVEVKIPAAGESITEAAIGSWLVEDGSQVEKDQEIAEVETDKATLSLVAPESGKIKIVSQTGQKVKVGEIACTIDVDAASKNIAKNTSVAAATAEEHNQQPALEPTSKNESPTASEQKEPTTASEEAPEHKLSELERSVKVTPLAQKMMKQNDLDVEAIIKGLKRISRKDVEKVINQKDKPEPDHLNSLKDLNQNDRKLEKVPMSPLRRKLGKRLVSVKNETAMLTTFNEVDMHNLMELRKKHQAKFTEKHGIKLGLISFFAKACAQTLFEYSGVNSFVEDENIVTPSYVDLSIAVQTEKGLLAPVIRNVHLLSIVQIEKEIAALAQKAKNARISIEEMEGGTFTITNGGIFGSMLSTPILNPPQSAILGMHNIVERPVAVDGEILIRPIMYVALSYDHRVIDGRDSVSFLIRIRELIENPLKLLIPGKDPELRLLDL